MKLRIVGNTVGGSGRIPPPLPTPLPTLPATVPLSHRQSRRGVSPALLGCRTKNEREVVRRHLDHLLQLQTLGSGRLGNRFKVPNAPFAVRGPELGVESLVAWSRMASEATVWSVEEQNALAAQQ